MAKIDSLNEELLEVGFTIDNDEYTFEKVAYRTIIINGVRREQQQTQIFMMRYIGDGCELDDDNNEIEGTEMCGFDILDENKQTVHTIFITDSEQIRTLVQLW